MHILHWNGCGGITNNESVFSRLGATISDGEATIRRIIFFESDSIEEDAADIISLPYFPQKNAAHPRHPAFKYHGNCSISPISSKSKIWQAELEYTTKNANSTDANGNEVTADTPPWELRPDNFSFQEIDETVPFEASYNSSGKLYHTSGVLKGEPVLPVCNSAGDPFKAEKVARSVELSFTYSTKKWDENFILFYGRSINSQSFRVAGVDIPAKCGLIRQLKPEYITVFDGEKIKWQYWHINVSILLDREQSTIYRRMLDIGDRAKFKSVSLEGDELLKMAGISTVLDATSSASQVCTFRLSKNFGTKKKPAFAPMGTRIFCSWDQYLQAVKVYMGASRIIALEDVYYPECEQLEQMPLNNGYLYTAAIPGSADYMPGATYKVKNFREYPALNWSALNLPEIGVK